jgi:serine/threonine protein kinase
MLKIYSELNLKPVPRTNVVVEHFGDEARFAEIKMNSDRIYSTRIEINGKDYIIKGETIKLKHINSNQEVTRNEWKDPLKTLHRITKDYHLKRLLSKSNKHLVTPLHLAITKESVAIGNVKDDIPRLYEHIEVLYEDYGKPLDELDIPDYKTLYNCLRQLCFSLLLLKSQSLHNIDISPTNIFYNKDKELLQLFDIGDHAERGRRVNLVNTSTEFAPPEYLSTTDEILMGKEREITGKSDVYCIAMMLYMVILNSANRKCSREVQGRNMGLMSRRIRSRDEHDKFVNEVIEKISEIENAKNKEERKDEVEERKRTEGALMKFIKSKFRKALDYDLNKRPSLAELFWKIRHFETKKNIKVPHTETIEDMKTIEGIYLDPVMTLSEETKVKISIEEELTKETYECHNKDHPRIELECEHKEVCITSSMVKNLLCKKLFLTEVRCLECEKKNGKEELKESPLNCRTPLVSEKQKSEVMNAIDKYKEPRYDKCKAEYELTVNKVRIYKKYKSDKKRNKSLKLEKNQLGDIGRIALKAFIGEHTDLISLNLSIVMLKV